MLNVYYQNVTGLRSKTNTFYINITNNDYDIIMITESWLVESIASEELFDNRYIVFRRDRSENKRGGGVILAFKKHLTVVERKDWESNAEDLWVTVITKNLKRINLCCVYIPPGANHSRNTYDFMDKLCELRALHHDDNFLIAGDFNLPLINWSISNDNIMKITNSHQSEIISKISDTLSFNELSQYCTFPNNNHKFLDLVFSSFPVIVSHTSQHLIPECKYHKSIIIDISTEIDLPMVNNKRTINLFKKANYENINNALNNIDWDAEFSNLTTDIAINRFYDILDKIIHYNVPSKKVQDNNSYPYWYSPALIKLTKEKYRIFKKWKKWSNPLDYQEFCVLRTRQKKVSNECHRQFIINAEVKISHDPKNFWSYVKSKRNSTGLPNTMKLVNVTANNPLAICNMFSKNFASTYNHNVTPKAFANNPQTDNPINISTISVSKEQIEKIINNFSWSLGEGYDKIPSYFIKMCSKELSKPLLLLFQSSLKEGIFPDRWKCALITPVFKSGSKNDIQNYRPISKLPIFSKILEKIVHEQLYDCVKSIITENQHGFMKKRSTVSNLAVFTEYISKSMDKRIQVDAIYTDFSKAFDKIDHILLLSKLLALGIHGDLYRWLVSYLNGRSQIVAVNGFNSEIVNVPSGVPQGSHLGPLLFTIFINDIVKCFKHAKVLLFADDMKIFLAINSFTECYKLQQDLNRLNEYCTVNYLHMNTAKCYVITFTKNKKKIEYNYHISNSQPLKKVNQIRDLGVLIDDKLSFKAHVDKIVKKSLNMLGFLFRIGKEFNNIHTLKILYYSYVRSHLEYASAIWNPLYNIHTKRIEAVQRKFVHHLNFKRQLRYYDMDSSIKHYGLKTLKSRRDTADMIYLHKVLSGHIDCPALLSSINIRVPSKITRDKSLFNIEIASTSLRQNSFLLRTCNHYNKTCLDADILSCNLRDFKKIVNRVF